MRRVILVVLSLASLLLCTGTHQSFAEPAEAPERIKAVMIGDRLVDVALKLGVVPEGMAIRASMWPMAENLKAAGQILGCPNYVTRKRPGTVALFMKKHGIHRVLIEKSPQFCLYKKQVNPVDLAAILKDVPGVRIEYADFSEGVGPAVTRIAKLLDRTDKGKEVRSVYEKEMSRIQAEISPKGLNKRVVILDGTYLSANGKIFVRAEVPGGYSDRFILEPLGCVNVAGAMVTDSMKASKGHVPATRLKGLARSAPDVIIATGDGFAVQKALHEALQRDPSLADIPALKNHEVYTLPFYGESSVLEYPHILRRWKSALAR